jgi:thioredoxin reductase
VAGVLDANVAVVGAGPAGIAAALAACERGASVVVIDEQPAPGGQIWRRAAGAEPAGAAAGTAIAALSASPATVLSGTAVWATAQDAALLTVDPAGVPGEVRARALVVATGAHDRPVAFPGWTLPGVMTAGGAQALGKAQGLAPGRRVVLAGAGPFLLPVACELVARGAAVVALAEATRRRDWLRHAAVAVRDAARLREYGRTGARSMPPGSRCGGVRSWCVPTASTRSSRSRWRPATRRGGPTWTVRTRSRPTRCVPRMASCPRSSSRGRSAVR